MQLSVIICSHNPREDYLERTLAGLKTQTLPVEHWELLLIDNASSAPLESHWDLSWHPNARHIREDELGLTPARLRGIREAGGGLLVFVDDDNVLHSDYLGNSVGIADQSPMLGCIGAGMIVPEFEVQPDPELLPYTGMLALRSVDGTHWSNDPADDCVPWGAGMIVRAHIAREHAVRLESQSHSLQLDRKGDQLNSCGDEEFSWTACSMGYGKGLFPELRITHLIPKNRIEIDYLLKIAEGHAFSKGILFAKYGREIHHQREEVGPASVLRAISTLSIDRFFGAGRMWMTWRARSEVEKLFRRASSRGRLRAIGLGNPAGHP